MRKLHTYIHLNYVRLEILFRKKKEKKKEEGQNGHEGRTDINCNYCYKSFSFSHKQTRSKVGSKLVCKKKNTQLSFEIPVLSFHEVARLSLSLLLKLLLSLSLSLIHSLCVSFSNVTKRLIIMNLSLSNPKKIKV